MTLVQAISQDFALYGSGRYLRAKEHDSLIVDTQKQRFYWNSRGLFGDLYDWLVKVKKINPREVPKQEGDLFDEIHLVVSDVQKPDQDLVSIFNKRAFETDYWTTYRGYTKETINAFRLGYTGQWATIPIFFDNQFLNFQCRKNSPKMVKYWYEGVGPHPFNFGILPVTDWVIITESPVDTIMCRQNGLPAVSQTSGASYSSLYKHYFTRFSHLSKIYIVYDNDEPGNKGANKVWQVFGEKAKIFTFNGFKEKMDISDFFNDGFTKDDLLSLLEKESFYGS